MVSVIAAVWLKVAVIVITPVDAFASCAAIVYVLVPSVLAPVPCSNTFSMEAATPLNEIWLTALPLVSV
jgi:hypothetical protein